MGFLSSIGKAISKTLDIGTTLFAHPIESIKAAVSGEKTIAQVTEKHFSQPLKTQIKQIGTATAGYAVSSVAAILSAPIVASVAPSIAAKVAPKLIAPAATIGTIAILAPETTKKVLTTPGLRETAVAGFIGGVPAALVVGAEKGGGILAAAAGVAAEKIKAASPAVKAAAVAVGAAAATGLAVAVGAKIIGAIKKKDEPAVAVQEVVPAVAAAASVLETPTVKKVAAPKKKAVKKKAVKKKAVKKKKVSKKKKKGRYTPHTAGKGKDTSHRRIRYTKKGQPYVIMADGKARFIKKTSAKRSHKLKGGRY